MVTRRCSRSGRRRTVAADGPLGSKEGSAAPSRSKERTCEASSAPSVSRPCLRLPPPSPMGKGEGTTDAPARLRCTGSSAPTTRLRAHSALRPRGRPSGSAAARPPGLGKASSTAKALTASSPPLVLGSREGSSAPRTKVPKGTTSEAPDGRMTARRARILCSRSSVASSSSLITSGSMPASRMARWLASRRASIATLRAVRSSRRCSKAASDSPESVPAARPRTSPRHALSSRCHASSSMRKASASICSRRILRRSAPRPSADLSSSFRLAADRLLLDGIALISIGRRSRQRGRDGVVDVDGASELAPRNCPPPPRGLTHRDTDVPDEDDGDGSCDDG